MTLQAFLTDKKIDPKQMQAGDPDLWHELNALFEQMSPASFDQQKKFRFNKWRQQYPLAFDPSEGKPKAKPKGRLPLKKGKPILHTDTSAHSTPSEEGNSKAAPPLKKIKLALRTKPANGPRPTEKGNAKPQTPPNRVKPALKTGIKAAPNPSGEDGPNPDSSVSPLETSSGSAKPLPRKKPNLTPPVLKKQQAEEASKPDLPPTE